MKIYAYGFSPKENSPNSVGGVEWDMFYEHLKRRIKEIYVDETYDIIERVFVLPDDMLPDEVTSYIDSHIWEERR